MVVNSSSRILCWNAHSLDGFKSLTITQMLKEKSIDFAGISETWKHFRGDVYDGVRCYGLDPVQRRRGLAWLGRPQFERNAFNKAHTEILEQHTMQTASMCAITWRLGDVVIILAYLPNGSSRQGIDELMYLYENVSEVHARVVIMGDLNTRMNIMNEGWNAAGKALRQHLQESRLKRLGINNVTYPEGQSCLDHVLTDCEERITNWGVFSDTITSDHHPIWIDLAHSSADDSTSTKRTKKVNWEKVSQYMEQRLAPFDEEETFEDELDKFTQCMKAGISKHSHTLKKRARGGLIRIRFDDELKELFKRRSKANGDEKTALTKEIRRIIRRRKREAWNKFVHKGAVKNKSKSLWGMFKQSRGRVAGDHVNIDGDPEKAEEIAELFGKAHIIPPHIAEHLSPERPNITPKSVPLPFEGVTDIELKKTLAKLPAKGSTGCDEISYLLLKKAGPKMMMWLVNCINYSLRTGEVSHLWLKSRIMPLAKSSGGFRPISLISNLAKLVERVIAARLNHYLRDNDLLPKDQYCNQGGTSEALRNLLNYIEDTPYPSYVVFFDIRKAFDRVHVPTLLRRLESLKVPEYITRWIASYTEDRTGWVGDSHFQLVNGIPQGSVLSPILFILYTEELLADLKNVYKAAYADDMAMAVHHKNALTTKNVLSRALSDFHKKSLKLGIELDSKKTKMMIVRSKKAKGKSAKRYEIKLGDKVLSYTDSYKYLGVWIDKRLSFRKWVDTKIVEVTRRNRFLFRLPTLTRRPLRTLWRGFNESYMMYGLPEIWNLLSPNQQERLLRIYRVSVRRIAGLPTVSPMDDALRAAGMSRLEELIAHRRAPIPEGRKRRPRLRTTTEHVDFPQTPSGRHQEITLARWRTGCLYTNDFKKKYHLSESDKCRRCVFSTETREHLLFECPSVPDDKRTELIRQTAEICEVAPNEVTLQHVVGKEPKNLHSNAKVSLGRNLTSFLDSIDFHA